MKLYVCYGDFTAAPRPGGHPCGMASKALKEAGHEPEIVKSYGWRVLPEAFNRTVGRREVKRLSPTDSVDVPLLQTDSGEIVQGSKEIAAWAKANPAGAAAAGAPAA
jgi:hypothetical protein